MWADLLISGAGSIPVAIALTAWAAYRRARPRDRRPFGERYHQEVAPALLAEQTADRTAFRMERR